MSLNSLKFIVFLILSNATFLVNAQVPVFEWASNQQYVGAMHERAITADTSGNVYITGYWDGYNDFDPGPADLLIQSMGNDMYLIKLDPAGNLLWVHTFGTLGVERGLSVFTDSIGNVYFGGIYGNTIDFDPGPGTYNLTPTTGVSFGFLASYDTNGNFRWARSLPGYLTGTLDTDDISYAPDGTILITDIFNGTIDFDPGPGVYTMTSSTFDDMYVLKLDLDGNFIWARHFEGGYDRGSSIKVHSSGNIFATGYYYDSIDLDPGVGVQTETALGLGDSYVLKLNSFGDLIWGKSFGGTNNDRSNEIEVDDQQNVYVSGLFKGTSDFDPGPNVASMTSEGDFDPFLLKLDANGNFQWAHNYGGSINDRKISVDLDVSGNIFVTGWFYDTLDFQPGPGVFNQIKNNVGADIFITKLTPTGGLSWVKPISGNYFNFGTSIKCATSGDFYVCGEYDETVDFNPGGGNAMYTSIGGYDGFNLKYSQCYQSNPVPDLASLPDVPAVCTIDSLVAPSATENCLGAIIGTPNVTFPITTIGTTVVTWTFDAGNGFVSSQNQTVIITDTEAPVPNVSNLPDVSFLCSTSTLTPPSATDNCSNSVTVTNNATFPILGNTTVTWTYDDNNGNTSTQTQNVVITPINNGISQTGGATLAANANGYSYQWIDCDNGNSPINGATNQTFTATSNGNYAVEITNGTCTVTSNCLNIADVSVSEIDGKSLVSIFPNPTSGKVVVKLNSEYQAVSVKLKDALGRLINTYSFSSTDLFEIELDGNNGMYFIEISTEDGKMMVYKIVKE